MRVPGADEPFAVTGTSHSSVRMHESLIIDGAHGEGGGQILRTGLALATLLGRAVRFTRIRAGRRRPGLAAQHLTAVRAAAALCAARLDGDALASQELLFAPQRPVRSGSYAFDVAAARKGGSAGGASLVLQTVLLPLALAPGRSDVLIQGGTHLPQSPPFDYVRDVWLPALRNLGIRATIALHAWGWYPVGKGAIRAEIAGAPPHAGSLASLQLLTPGRLLRVTGRAVAANLPAHIPQRMADRATSLLAAVAGSVDVQIESRACRVSRRRYLSGRGIRARARRLQRPWRAWQALGTGSRGSRRGVAAPSRKRRRGRSSSRRSVAAAAVLRGRTVTLHRRADHPASRNQRMGHRAVRCCQHHAATHRDRNCASGDNPANAASSTLI